jgi:hypothetical protein
MKRNIVGLALLLMLSASTPLLAQKGSYMPVGRSNDPFVFCTEGVPTDFWIALDPLQGTYTITNPDYFNPFWIPTYVAICPKVMSTGSWGGKGGSPDLVPFYH